MSAPHPDLSALSIDLERCAEDLQHSVRSASFNCDIWWKLKNAHTRGLYLDTMNRYTLFFQTSIHAHFAACVVACYRLLEKRRDTQNLHRLMALARRHPSLQQETAEKAKSIFTMMLKVYQKVSILRNNVFGHKSEKLTSDAAFAKTGLAPDDLPSHIEDAKTLLNIISGDLMRRRYAFNLSPACDLERVLRDLKAHCGK